MEMISVIALIFLFLSSVLLVLVPSLRHSSCKKRRPPGPQAFPYVGSIHHMLTSQPQVALRDLAGMHGPVMYQRLGQIDAVVISSPAEAQEVMQANDLSFAARPTHVVREMIDYGNLDLLLAPYGDYWRVMRKLCVVHLLGASEVRLFMPIRDRETMSLVAEIRTTAAGGKAVNVGRLLVSCANSITWPAIFGDGCSRQYIETFLLALAVLQKDGTGVCVSDFFPYLLFVDVLTGLRHRLWRAYRQVDEVLNKVIDECDDARRMQEMKKKVRNGGDEDKVAAAAAGEDNLLSKMLRVRDKEEEELALPFNNGNIKAILLDLFIGATDTTASAAEWVMSELMRHPGEMAKAQAEVRDVFNNITPHRHESHMDKLHYTRMVIKETLRLHPSVPLPIRHLNGNTCDIGGFEVTKGSWVLINAWAMAISVKYWGDDAEDFRPTRFEEQMADYNGTEFCFLPFGSGRRMCPSVGFGMATLELIVARLLYYFDWSLPGNMLPEELNMETVVHATARRRNQLWLVATPHHI